MENLKGAERIRSSYWVKMKALELVKEWHFGLIVPCLSGQETDGSLIISQKKKTLTKRQNYLNKIFVRIFLLVFLVPLVKMHVFIYLFRLESDDVSILKG